MLGKWLRENKVAAALLTLVRLYVGYEWVEAGWHKLTGEKPFDATGFMKNAIAKPVADATTHEAVYPTFTAFLKHFALPHVGVFNVMVPWGELLVGIGLILGALTTTAIFFGLMMNFMYMFAGTVSTNPWMVLFGFLILAAGANAGKFGVDHLALPYLNKAVTRVKDKLHLHGPKGNLPIH